MHKMIRRGNKKVKPKTINLKLMKAPKAENSDELWLACIHMTISKQASYLLKISDEMHVLAASECVEHSRKAVRGAARLGSEQQETD